MAKLLDPNKLNLTKNYTYLKGDVKATPVELPRLYTGKRPLLREQKLAIFGGQTKSKMNEQINTFNNAINNFPIMPKTTPKISLDNLMPAHTRVPISTPKVAKVDPAISNALNMGLATKRKTQEAIEQGTLDPEFAKKHPYATQAIVGIGNVLNAPFRALESIPFAKRVQETAGQMVAPDPNYKPTSTGNTAADIGASLLGTGLGALVPGGALGATNQLGRMAATSPLATRLLGKVPNKAIGATRQVLEDAVGGAAFGLGESAARGDSLGETAKNMLVEGAMDVGGGALIRGAGKALLKAKNIPLPKLPPKTQIELPKLTPKSKPEIPNLFNKVLNNKIELPNLSKLAGELEPSPGSELLNRAIPTLNKTELPATKIDIEPTKYVAATAENGSLMDPLFAPEVKPKSRGFAETVAESATADRQLKEGITGTDISYKPISNKDTLSKAKKIIDNDLDEAVKMAKSTGPATAESNAISQLLIQKAQKEGRYQDAIDLVEITARKATNQGQAIQALSMWGKLTPEGMLRYAQRTIDKANAQRPELELKLSPNTAKEITEAMEKIQSLPEGREKVIEIAKVLDKVGEQVPPTILQKISSIQTMAHLLNPKTAIRNIVGNVAFAASENVSDIVGTGLDKAVSKITGQRTKLLPDLKTQFQGFNKGFKLGLEDALLGIDTSSAKTQFDLPTKVFRGKIGSSLEKMLNIELRATDRAFYNATYEDSLRQQMQLANVGKPTEAMIERAHYDGLYRTFQDDNAISRAFSGIKRSLNSLTGSKDFGLGDLVIKYPKTPANILARGIEYSPAGFIKTVMELSKPLMGKQFNQREFVDATSRALVGTAALIGTGSILNQLGIITGNTEKDSDIRAVQREVGLGDYKINVSALKRFVLSGFEPEVTKLQEGDLLATYDWLQPAAINLAIGANINENKGDVDGVLGQALAALESGSNTLASQPLLQGVSKMFQYGDVTKGVTETAKEIPSSFTPTLLNQFKQLTDNTSRNTYDPNTTRESINIVKSKIPGLAKTLEPRIGVFGKENETYQGNSNNPFNVFLNPAFLSRYKPNPATEMVLDIYEKSGEKIQAPRLVPKTITHEGETIRLNASEMADYQRLVGEQALKRFTALASNKAFRNSSPEKQAKELQKELTNINAQSKKKILNERAKKKQK